MDRLDRQLIYALRLNGRAPFRLVADVLGSSEQTVARRYRRLREAGIVRVQVLSEPEQGLSWSVRIQVVPGGALRLAEALAAREDTSWVSIHNGGAEVLCTTSPRSARQRDELLLQRLPQTNLVTGVVAHATLHMFAGRGLAEWSAFADPLDGPQRRALAPVPRSGPVSKARGARTLTPEDRELLAALAPDGRASYAALASETGATSAQVRRRMEALLAGGGAYVDTEVSPDLLGFGVQAAIWMTVAPGRLRTVGEQVAALPQTAFAAALTGPSNLAASVCTRSLAELYECVADDLGALEGIERIEVAITLQRIKQAASVMEGPRLPPPF